MQEHIPLVALVIGPIADADRNNMPHLDKVKFWGAGKIVQHKPPPPPEGTAKVFVSMEIPANDRANVLGWVDSHRLASDRFQSASFLRDRLTALFGKDPQFVETPSPVKLQFPDLPTSRVIRVESVMDVARPQFEPVEPEIAEMFKDVTQENLADTWQAAVDLLVPSSNHPFADAVALCDRFRPALRMHGLRGVTAQKIELRIQANMARAQEATKAQVEIPLPQQPSEATVPTAAFDWKKLVAERKEAQPQEHQRRLAAKIRDEILINKLMPPDQGPSFRDIFNEVRGAKKEKKADPPPTEDHRMERIEQAVAGILQSLQDIGSKMEFLTNRVGELQTRFEQELTARKLLADLQQRLADGQQEISKFLSSLK